MAKSLTICVFSNGTKEVKTIEHTLEELQSIVGGYIETHRITDKLFLVCNEDSVTEELQPTLMVRTSCFQDLIVGDCFIARFDGIDNFTDLTDADVEWINRHYVYAKTAGVGLIDETLYK